MPKIKSLIEKFERASQAAASERPSARTASPQHLIRKDSFYRRQSTFEGPNTPLCYRQMAGSLVISPFRSLSRSQVCDLRNNNSRGTSLVQLLAQSAADVFSCSPSIYDSSEQSSSAPASPYAPRSPAPAAGAQILKLRFKFGFFFFFSKFSNCQPPLCVRTALTAATLKSPNATLRSATEARRVAQRVDRH